MPPGQLIEGLAPLVTTFGIRRRLERGLRVSLFVSLCPILMFGPLALGGVQDWSTAVFEIASAALLLLWMTWQLTGGEVAIRWSPLFGPMLAFFGVVLVQIAFHRTAYSYDSLSELWLLIAYGILTFAAAQMVQSDEDFVLRFGKTMAGFGALYAVFAVLQSFTSDGKIYWRITPRAGNIYGSYVNHNHYAGFVELILPTAMVLAFNGSVRGAKRVLLVFGAMLMAASVFLCQSRGGMFAVTVETAFLVVFWMRQFSARKSAAAFVLFCLVTALFLAWIAPQQLGARMTDTHDPARWLIHRDSVRMFAAHPILGSGLGTFATVFPRYRTFYDRFLINYAHDDYLQLLLETGMVGFGIGVWFLVVLFREGLRNLRPARVSPAAAASTAALAGCIGLLAHSFMDFNLHIPANAALFYVLCAVATSPVAARIRNGCNG
ncbi:MAG: O-antigen ligase family protein [Terriglobales bacterium]